MILYIVIAIGKVVNIEVNKILEFWKILENLKIHENLVRWPP